MNKAIADRMQRIKDYQQMVADSVREKNPVQALALSVELGGQVRRLGNDLQAVINARAEAADAQAAEEQEQAAAAQG